MILFCCILNVEILNASDRSGIDTTVYVVADEGPKFKGDIERAVAEPYLYDEFIAMLEREGQYSGRDRSCNNTDVCGTETTILKRWGKCF